MHFGKVGGFAAFANHDQIGIIFELGDAFDQIPVGKPTDTMQEKLDEAAAILRKAGYSVDAGFASGEPEDVIKDKIETDKIDLLVMGAYGHSRIRNLIIGSTTTEMVRSCQVPVMMFR